MRTCLAAFLFLAYCGGASTVPGQSSLKLGRTWNTTETKPRSFSRDQVRTWLHSGERSESLSSQPLKAPLLAWRISGPQNLRPLRQSRGTDRVAGDFDSYSREQTLNAAGKLSTRNEHSEIRSARISWNAEVGAASAQSQADLTENEIAAEIVAVRAMAEAAAKETAAEIAAAHAIAEAAAEAVRSEAATARITIDEISKAAADQVAAAKAVVDEERARSSAAISTAEEWAKISEEVAMTAASSLEKAEADMATEVTRAQAETAAALAIAEEEAVRAVQAKENAEAEKMARVAAESAIESAAEAALAAVTSAEDAVANAMLELEKSVAKSKADAALREEEAKVASSIRQTEFLAYIAALALRSTAAEAKAELASAMKAAEDSALAAARSLEEVANEREALLRARKENSDLEAALEYARKKSDVALSIAEEAAIEATSAHEKFDAAEQARQAAENARMHAEGDADAAAADAAAAIKAAEDALVSAARALQEASTEKEARTAAEAAVKVARQAEMEAKAMAEKSAAELMRVKADNYAEIAAATDRASALSEQAMLEVDKATAATKVALRKSEDDFRARLAAEAVQAEAEAFADQAASKAASAQARADEEKKARSLAVSAAQAAELRAAEAEEKAQKAAAVAESAVSKAETEKVKRQSAETAAKDAMEKAKEATALALEWETKYRDAKISAEDFAQRASSQLAMVRASEAEFAAREKAAVQRADDEARARVEANEARLAAEADAQSAAADVMKLVSENAELHSKETSALGRADHERAARGAAEIALDKAQSALADEIRRSKEVELVMVEEKHASEARVQAALAEVVDVQQELQVKLASVRAQQQAAAATAQSEAKKAAEAQMEAESMVQIAEEAKLQMAAMREKLAEVQAKAQEQEEGLRKELQMERDALEKEWKAAVGRASEEANALESERQELQQFMAATDQARAEEEETAAAAQRQAENLRRELQIGRDALEKEWKAAVMRASEEVDLLERERQEVHDKAATLDQMRAKDEQNAAITQLVTVITTLHRLTKMRDSLKVELILAGSLRLAAQRELNDVKLQAEALMRAQDEQLAAERIAHAENLEEDIIQQESREAILALSQHQLEVAYEALDNMREEAKQQMNEEWARLTNERKIFQQQMTFIGRHSIEMDVMTAVDSMPPEVQLPTVKILEDSFADHGSSSIWDAVEEMTHALDDSRTEAEQELLDAKASIDLANAQNLVAMVAASELALALQRSEAARVVVAPPIGASAFDVVYALAAAFELSTTLQKSGAVCFMALSLALEVANGQPPTSTTVAATSAMVLALKQAQDSRSLAEAATLQASANEAALEDAEEAAAFAESALELLEGEAMEAQKVNAVAITAVVWMSAIAYDNRKLEYAKQLERARAEVEKTNSRAESTTNEMAAIAKSAVETASLALRKIKAREAKIAVAELAQKATTEVKAVTTNIAADSDLFVESKTAKLKRKVPMAKKAKIRGKRRQRKEGMRDATATENAKSRSREVVTRVQNSAWRNTLEKLLLEFLRILMHVCSLRAEPVCFWGV